MKQKIKNIKRRWRKLSRLDRALLAATSILAVIILPLSPMGSLCVVLSVINICNSVAQRRMRRFIYHCEDKFIRYVIYAGNKQLSLLDDFLESTNKYIDLLKKYENLRAAHNKLLRRRRKENNL